MEYIGHLENHDPLYEYLRHDIFPQIGCSGAEGIRVFSTNGSNDVYIYEDRQTCKRVVGKFYFSPEKDNWEQAGRLLDRECFNTNLFRSFLGEHHYAARILGRNDNMNRLLVVEYCYGEPLDNIIMRCINNGERELLFEKLRALAYFLATVHNRSAQEHTVDFNYCCHYTHTMITCLQNKIPDSTIDSLRRKCEDWRNDPRMWQDRTVLVHGDATPSNFFFGDGMSVITFDLERVKWTDRIFDVGRIVGELQHFFLRSTGDKNNAEPFIQYFLQEYAWHFPDQPETFQSITARIPFHMGTTLLRIARNSYLDQDYRMQLVRAAKECLRRK